MTSDALAAQVTAWATATLVFVTAIYAYLTWRLSRANAESARYARIAAEAATTAVALAAGDITPSMTARFDPSDGGWDPYGSILLTNGGRAVTIASVEILGLARPYGPRTEWSACKSPVRLEVRGRGLPAELGHGETMEMRAGMTDTEALSRVGQRPDVRTKIVGAKVKVRFSMLPGGMEHSCELQVGDSV